VKRQTGVTVTYVRSGPSREVDSAIGIHVYRVLQEALSNVARHSGTDAAWVRLRFTGDGLELEIEDRGKGIDPQTGRRGLGIVGMKERAALVGGNIEFLRPAQGGLLIRLTVPLQQSGERLRPYRAEDAPIRGERGWGPASSK
jgi:signal transduction histidine kinase